MKFSNKYILAGHGREELNTPVIARVGFNELQFKVHEITGKPVTCNSCGASVTDIKSIKDEPPAGLHFVCDFCNSLNKIDENQFDLLKEQKEHVIEYFEEIRKKEIDKVIACIDRSGSMKGAPIEAVKQSLIKTLTDFSVNAPDSTFALITFTCYVSLYNADGNEVLRVDGQDLYDENSISVAFGNIDYKFEKIKDVFKKWSDFIPTITDLADTALGPAIFGAVSLLKEEGGRIILLTDGMANMGVGDMTRPSTKKDFYNTLGRTCADRGIIIEIVGVVPASGSSIELETIGEMAYLTGGDVYLAKTEEIAGTFDTISKSEVLGKNVNVKVFVPASIELKEISGEVFYNKRDHFLEVKAGSVNPDRQFCMSLDTVKDIHINQELPVQIQIEYTGTDGHKRKRIYNEKLIVTDREEDIAGNFASEISDEFYIQKAAELARKLHNKEGIEKLKYYNNKLDLYEKVAPQDKKGKILRSSDMIKKEIDDIVKMEQKIKDKDAYYSYHRKKSSYGSISMKSIAKTMRESADMTDLMNLWLSPLGGTAYAMILLHQFQLAHYQKVIKLLHMMKKKIDSL